MHVRFLDFRIAGSSPSSFSFRICFRLEKSLFSCYISNIFWKIRKTFVKYCIKCFRRDIKVLKKKSRRHFFFLFSFIFIWFDWKVLNLQFNFSHIFIFPAEKLCLKANYQITHNVLLIWKIKIIYLNKAVIF